MVGRIIQLRLFLVICGFLLVQSCGCQSNTNQQQNSQDSLPTRAVDPAFPGDFSEPSSLRFDKDQISTFISRFPQFKSLTNDLQTFYSARQYSYAWYDTAGRIEQADNLFNKIMNIDEEGISQKAVYLDTLSSMMAETDAKPDPQKELMLTSQYFDYAHKVWGGLTEKQTRSLNWFLPKKKLDLPFLMDSLLRDTSSSLIKKGYSIRQYDLLKGYLKRYRSLDSLKKWNPIADENKSYRLGDTSKVIGQIREKLFLVGDLPVNSSSNHFDKELEAGVKSFQARFGLKQDGVVGPDFLRQLNAPVSNYIKQIIVNMERSRWIPVQLTDEYLVVNIPAYQLIAYDNDKVAFRMNVVVGKAVHKTVIFNGDLKYIVFSPYWNVPPGIMRNEVLPAIKRDPGYLKRNNMEWNGNSVRQKPGPNNSLGLVKFLFPNEYNIYLHDSPAKNLFNEETRAFSHGCIRVAEPKKLAVYLLRKDPGWTEKRIDKAMHASREQYVTLKDHVPVYIAYLTAWVDNTGKLNLRKDIYNRDQHLAAMILKK
ncbi:MAG: murein L,D-transpeptidase [Bacteroidetes bacterium]|nr:MAG: murein L,D-transpeptidase [Bacteroidota bacterium]